MKISESQELSEILRPGNKVKIFYKENNRNNQIREIRKIVDEEYVVYRVWSKRKGYWDYRIDMVYSFYLRFIDGYLKKC